MKKVIAKKTAPAKKSAAEREAVLPRLIQGVSAYYRADPTTPSVILSHLPSGKYYASIRRYESSYGRDGKVLVSATEESLGEVIKTLARKWLEFLEPLDNLRKAMK